MKYTLAYTRRAEKDIKKLDNAARKRIGKAILQYSKNPFKHSESLTASKLGSYRFRIGDYRVIFDIENNDIVILRVAHRKEIYKR